MVRAGSRAPSTGRAPSVNKLRKTREKPYKVQIESVMAKKKKLKLHDIHGSAKPLNGYTYLPVGFSDLAEECKELSRKKDADVAVVSAGSRTAAHDPSKLSHHIYRVGYHFRTDIFDAACNKLGYAERNGKLEKVTGMERSSRFEKTMSRYGSRFDMIDVNNRSQEESMKVKKYIRELFPKIPEADLQEIYERAWEQGASTVGNANDLSLSRQVQLATIARIRHTYTNYDNLLREGSWKDARTAVEHKCLAKLIEWRGEHDDDAEELEEILRETIVIDDESDDDDVQVHTNGGSDSDSSLEIVQHTVAPKDLRVEPNEENHFRRLPGPNRRVQNNNLPAAIQARWQNARSERYGSKRSQPNSDPALRITVALDEQGKAPRAFQSGGTKYVRLSPDPQDYPRHSLPQQGALPDHRVPAGASSALPYIHQAPHMRPIHPYHGWTSHPVHSETCHDTEPVGIHHTLANTAIQSIEESHEARPVRGARSTNFGPPIVDLTTPPKPRHWDSHTNLAGIHGTYQEHRPATTWNTSHNGYEETQYIPGRPQSQVPPPARAQTKPALPRSHSGVEVIDLTRSRDWPMPDQGLPSYAEHSSVPRMKMPDVERVYRQPVYGQVAYPQPRSHYTPAPMTPPRPVHGAPAAVQSVTAFGAPSPQRYFAPSRRLAYPKPDK